MDDVERAFECVAKQFESFLILRVEILMASTQSSERICISEILGTFSNVG